MSAWGRSALFVAALAVAGTFTTEATGGTRSQQKPQQGADARRKAARIELGRRLFYDPAVSRTGFVSCASCHDPNHGFSDPVHPSQDEFGPAKRRSMPLHDLGPGPFHSDGEFGDMQELLEARLMPFDELDIVDRQHRFRSLGFTVDRYGNVSGGRPALAPVEARVAQEGFYARAFRDAFANARPTLERVMVALTDYLASLRSADNALDRYLEGDPQALTTSARRGLELFEGKAGCATCHLTRPVDGRAPLRDGKIHDTGIAWLAARAQGSKQPATDADAGFGAHGERSSIRRRNHMRFKTPTLRDVARRAPYMHDGSRATLLDVIEHYDRGGARHGRQDPAIRPLHLTNDEKDDLLAFLFALSGDERAGLSDAPEWLGRETVVRLVLPGGKALANADVEIHTAGAGFRGVAIPEQPQAARTDRHGRVRFPFPPTTHARFEVAGHRVSGGRPVPDLAGDVELMAVPVTHVALQVMVSLDDDARFPTSVRALPRQVEDEFGRVTHPRTGEVLTFEFASEVAPNQGLYLARRPAGDPGSARRRLIPRRGRGDSHPGQADLDLEGGGLTFVNLRPGHEILASLRERRKD